jgi:sugar lactone lactonase YvrE
MKHLAPILVLSFACEGTFEAPRDPAVTPIHQSDTAPVQDVAQSGAIAATGSIAEASPTGQTAAPAPTGDASGPTGTTNAPPPSAPFQPPPASSYVGQHPQAGTPIAVTQYNAGVYVDDTCGVTWSAADQALLFTVCQINSIVRWRPNVTGDQYDTVRPFVVPDGQDARPYWDDKVGVAFAPDGALLVAEAKAHRLTRAVKNDSAQYAYGDAVTIVDNWEGVPFNTPKYVVARSDGNIYFSDPSDDLGNTNLAFTGMFRVDPQGHVSLISTKGSAGIAITYDQRALIVASLDRSQRLSIDRYPIALDGSVGDPVEIVPAGSIYGGFGICVDQADNIFVTVRSSGVNMYTAAGELAGTIDVGGADDCAFGGADMKTMFVTTSSSAAGVVNLWKIPMAIPGMP